MVDALPAGPVAQAPAPTLPHLAWTVVSHELLAGHVLVPLPAIPAMPTLSLPAGFRGLDGLRGSDPLLGYPMGWRVSTEAPGGCSVTYTLTNPAHPGETVPLQANACHCKESPDGGLGLIKTLDAVVGPVQLTDHITLGLPAFAAGLVSRTLTATAPDGSGNEILWWTLPTPDAGLAKSLVSSFVAAWPHAASQPSAASKPPDWPTPGLLATRAHCIFLKLGLRGTVALEASKPRPRVGPRWRHAFPSAPTARKEHLMSIRTLIAEYLQERLGHLGMV